MTKRRSSRRRVARQAPRREGFTLVELMIAVLVMSIGLLGLAGLSVVAGAQWRGASKQQTAALVVQSRFDSLTSVPCVNLAASGTQNGTSITSGVKERWMITDGNDIKTIVDTVTFAGRKQPLAYKSVIPCRD